MMLQRNRQPELMDDPDLGESEHQRALAGLARLNRISGMPGAMYRRLRRYVPHGRSKLKILDVASGAGDIPIACARRAMAAGINFEYTMIDFSEFAVEEQQRRAKAAGVVVNSAVYDCLRQPLPGGFDVITCSLFMHHLDDRETIKLIQSMQAATPRAILISDLDRSAINLLLVGLAARAVSRSRVVHADSISSVRGAYTRGEFKSLAEEALLRPIHVEASLPCRFFAIIDDETVPLPVPAFA